MINIFVPGNPAPQGSKEYKGHRGGKPVLVDQCKRLPDWKADVKKIAQQAMIEQQMLEKQIVHLSLYFYMPRPRSHYRSDGKLKLNAPVRCINAPDLTKLVRAVEDAMTGTVYDDDSRVVMQDNEKYYEKPVIGPGVHIIVDIAEDTTPNYTLLSRETSE